MKLLREFVENTEITADKSHHINGVFMQAEIVNRNGRIYPMAVMEREVDKYRTNFINTRRALGEAEHPQCCHPKTKILTIDGWKFIKDINDDEIVFTLNMETGVAEKERIKKKIASPYKGKMIKLSNGRGGFYTVVTPNHRFVLRDRRGKLSFMTAADIHSGEFKLNHHSIPKTFGNGLVAESPKTIEVGGYTWSFDDYVSFMALWLAEGSATRNSSKPGTYKFQISQNEGDKADRIRELLDRLPIKMNETSKIREYSGKVCVLWHKGNYDLGTYLAQFGKSHEKFIPDEILQNLDARTADLFIEWYHLGDGRGPFRAEPGTARMKTDVFTVSERLATDLSYVATLAGYSVHLSYEDRDEDCIIENRIIKAANRRRIYYVLLGRTAGVYLDDRCFKTEEIEYDDMVYCVETENGNFMAMDETGYTFWSGNSPAVNIDRVSHLVTELRRDGNNFIGKAKILDTPMGRTVKALVEGGVSFGVSSRGLGTIREQAGAKIVQNDFMLAAIDIVISPSGPDCYVEGLMEEAEWVWDGRDWRPLEESRDRIRNAKRTELEAVMAEEFDRFLKNLR